MAVKLKMKPNGDVTVETGNYLRSKYNTEPNLGGVRTEVEALGLDWSDVSDETATEKVIGNNQNFYNNQLRQIKKRLYDDLSQAEFDDLVANGEVIVSIRPDKVKKVKDLELDGREVDYTEVLNLIKLGLSNAEISELLGTDADIVTPLEADAEQEILEDVETMLNEGATLEQIASEIGISIDKVNDKVEEIGQGDCGTPSNITIKQVTEKLVLVKWIDHPNGTNYNFQYRPEEEKNYKTDVSKVAPYWIVELEEGAYAGRWRQACDGKNDEYSKEVIFKVDGGFSVELDQIGKVLFEYPVFIEAVGQNQKDLDGVRTFGGVSKNLVKKIADGLEVEYNNSDTEKVIIGKIFDKRGEEILKFVNSI